MMFTSAFIWTPSNCVVTAHNHTVSLKCQKTGSAATTLNLDLFPSPENSERAQNTKRDSLCSGEKDSTDSKATQVQTPRDMLTHNNTTII